MRHTQTYNVPNFRKKGFFFIIFITNYCENMCEISDLCHETLTFNKGGSGRGPLVNINWHLSQYLRHKATVGEV